MIDEHALALAKGEVPMKIYLAGKISKNDWRHSVVPDLRDVDYEKPIPKLWLPTPITDRITYVGPFFVGCDHGCSHGENTHGSALGCAPIDPPSVADRRRQVHELCNKAIRDCDVFYAWLGHDDALTAYGTLAEIGYAAALGKKIIIGSNCTARCCTCLHDNLWFVKLYADDDGWYTGASLIHTDTPEEAIRYVLDRLHPSLARIDMTR